jgi:large subunit ribosomal protein L35
MPKAKTHQGANKRLRKTASGKLMQRSAGQGHFNSRESGKTTKNKRRDTQMSSANNNLKKILPHN